MAENHHGCHRKAALDVGIVETFHVNRLLIQPQVFLYGIKDAVYAVFRVNKFFLTLFVELVILRVAFRKLQQLLFIAPLRHGIGDARQLKFGHQWNDDFFCIAAEPRMQVGNGQREQFFGGFVQLFLQFNGMRLYNGPRGHFHKIDIGRLFIFND